MTAESKEIRGTVNPSKVLRMEFDETDVLLVKPVHGYYSGEELRDALLEAFPLNAPEDAAPEPLVLPGDIVRLTKKTRWRAGKDDDLRISEVIDFDLPAYGVVLDEEADISPANVAVRVFGSGEYGHGSSLEVLPHTVKLEHRPTTKENA